MSAALPVREEQPADRLAVRRLLLEAFPTAAEANLVEALHRDRAVVLALVAEGDSGIVGHLLFSRLLVHTGSETHQGVSLAPVAVAGSHRRQGVAARLIDAGLQQCRERGETFVAVLGDPAYYSRFGFQSRLAEPLASPFGGGEAWMALELVPGALADLSGQVEFARAFQSLEE